MTGLLSDTTSCEVEPGGYTLTLYRGPTGLSRLRASWLRLTDNLALKRFFHRYSWYRSYIDSLEKNPETVLFLLAMRGDTPAALFPLKQTVRKFSGLSFRCLEVPAHSHMNLGDFIFEKNEDNAQLVRLAVRHLRRLSGVAWDLIQVPSALGDSAAGYALKKAPVSLSVTTLSGNSNQLDCSHPNEQLEENFKGHFRRNLRRQQRRAHQMGKLEFHSYSSVGQIRRYFPEFLRVEASGWKGEHGTKTAISCDPSVRAFYQRVIDEFGSSGECQLNLLNLNRKCIAGQLCLFVDHIPYILKIGFDEAYAEISPGNLVMGEMIHQCAEDARIKTLSFVTGRDWNFNWGATSMPVYMHRIFNPRTLKGWLGYLICRARKALKRLALTPEQARKTSR